TFLEYFCASEYVRQFQQAQTLTIEQLITEVFGKHWQDESWHEVLRLIAGMIDARFVGEIIEYLMEQKINRREFVNEMSIQRNRRWRHKKVLRKEGLLNLLLAANCLAEVRNKAAIAPIANRLQEVLKKEVEQEYPYPFKPEAAAAVVSAIATVGQDTPTTLNWLKSCLQFSSSPFVPEAAVQAIAQNWKDNPETLPLLRQLAQSDNNSNVRGTAVEEIARGWKDDSETLPLLRQLAQSDKYEWVRHVAVVEIARAWKDNSETLPLLQQLAQSDDNSNVRDKAVEEIARGWKDDSDEKLREFAREELELRMEN
ncbi:MAG: NTPase, partial [Symploca sp. SIO2E6]|nr:NTPase [Symploca sp. SIO2E6]